MTEEENKQLNEIDNKLDRIEDDEITISLLYQKVDLLESIIQKQEAELNKKDKQLEEQKNINKKLSIENQKIFDENMELIQENCKKDKIIDLMAGKLANLQLTYFKKEQGGQFLGLYRCYTKDDWKQYFEEEVKEEQYEKNYIKIKDSYTDKINTIDYILLRIR